MNSFSLTDLPYLDQSDSETETETWWIADGPIAVEQRPVAVHADRAHQGASEPGAATTRVRPWCFPRRSATPRRVRGVMGAYRTVSACLCVRPSLSLPFWLPFSLARSLPRSLSTPDDAGSRE